MFEKFFLAIHQGKNQEQEFKSEKNIFLNKCFKNWGKTGKVSLYSDAAFSLISVWVLLPMKLEQFYNAGRDIKT